MSELFDQANMTAIVPLVDVTEHMDTIQKLQNRKEWSGFSALVMSVATVTFGIADIFVGVIPSIEQSSSKHLIGLAAATYLTGLCGYTAHASVTDIRRFNTEIFDHSEQIGQIAAETIQPLLVLSESTQP